MTTRTRSPLILTVLASFWMFGGRALGLLWTLAIIHRLGIGDYGQYAMGFALATLIAIPIDNYFVVGTVRSADGEFRHDRSTRLIVGVALFAFGFVFYQSFFVLALGFILAGAEIAYNVFQSSGMRAGRADRISINGAIRQAGSIGLAIPYLYISDEPTIEGACLAYFVPYVVLMVIAAWRCRAHRPKLPRRRSNLGILFAEAFGFAAYENADVLFLGLLTDQATAGYYATATMAANAISAVGISYAQTFHERLRGAGGHAKSGPPPRETLLLATGLGAVMVLVGIALAIAGTSPQLWGAVLLLSLLTTMRFAKHALSIVLVVQRRDTARVQAVFVCIAIKTALIVGLVSFGAIGAAAAAALTEPILVSWYARLVYPRLSIRSAAKAIFRTKAGQDT